MIDELIVCLTIESQRCGAFGSVRQFQPRAVTGNAGIYLFTYSNPTIDFKDTRLTEKRILWKRSVAKIQFAQSISFRLLILKLGLHFFLQYLISLQVSTLLHPAEIFT